MGVILFVELRNWPEGAASGAKYETTYGTWPQVAMMELSRAALVVT